MKFSLPYRKFFPAQKHFFAISLLAVLLSACSSTGHQQGHHITVMTQGGTAGGTAKASSPLGGYNTTNLSSKDTAKNPVNAHYFLGKSPEYIKNFMGDPHFLWQEKTMQVWHFQGQGCELQVFFQTQEQHRVVHIESQPHNPQARQISRCSIPTSSRLASLR